MPPPIRLRSAEPPTPLVTYRGTPAAPELRGERRLCFYAAVFDVPAQVTENGQTFTEVIRPGAFAATLAARSNDVYACVEHRRAETFSEQSTGLLLQEDARGLFASCYLPDTAVGNRVLADVQAGRLRGCSFAFRTARERVTQRAGKLPLVEVLAADLVDVCVTANPVYAATVVSVRSEGKARERRLRLLKLRT